ncbi:prostaglandin D2 receptor-like [Leptodactylus fuscus]|uniref:prostaglandin D2 receptor-like n=1 Tax=Leptodactylus fuscus TaxID=238119 RepID=UPI003F4EC9A5
MELYPCSSRKTIQENYYGLPSSLLFTIGVLGNVIALIILWNNKQNIKKKKKSIFYLLVTGLTIVNLLGKLMVCPVVLGAYSKNQTLVQLSGSNSLCQYFAFCMTFFGLAQTLILLAMVLDCWLALAQPFIYHSYITNKVGILVPLKSCIFSLGFCSLPLFGIGNFVQYCPGTWCFIQMTVKNSEPSHLFYSVLYGTVMGLLIIAIVIFNVDIMRRLYKMHRRQPNRNAIGNKVGLKPMNVKQAGMEELDHLILFAIMTVLFVVCSLPLTGRVYVGLFTVEANEYYDLIVLRLFSSNSIVSPWVFIIFRTSKFHMHMNRLCCQANMKKQPKPQLVEERPQISGRLCPDFSSHCFQWEAEKATGCGKNQHPSEFCRGGRS